MTTLVAAAFWELAKACVAAHAIPLTIDSTVWLRKVGDLRCESYYRRDSREGPLRTQRGVTRLFGDAVLFVL